MARRMTTRSSPDVEPVHILSVTQALRNARTLFEEHNSSFVEQRSSPQNEVAEDDLERTVTPYLTKMIWTGIQIIGQPKTN